MERKALMVSRSIEKLEVSAEEGMLVKTTSSGKIYPLKGNPLYKVPAGFKTRALKGELGEKLEMIEQNEAVVTARPSKEFLQTIADHTNAYIFESKEPPAEIATTIKNIADDYLNENEIVIRAGDYISLQNYIRSRGT